MTLAEAVQVRVRGGFIATRQRGACGLRARHRFAVAAVGGLRGTSQWTVAPTPGWDNT